MSNKTSDVVPAAASNAEETVIKFQGWQGPVFAVVTWEYKPRCFAPVEARGAIDGKNFYFRSRGDTWSLQVFEPDVSDTDECYFLYSAPWGEKEFDASYMPLDVAETLIIKALSFYLRSKQ